MVPAYRGTRKTVMCAFAKLDLRENIAKQVKYLNVLKEGVLSEYNHGVELKLSRHLPICATSRVSPYTSFKL